jgi:hypothetical protein
MIDPRWFLLYVETMNCVHLMTQFEPRGGTVGPEDARVR